MNGLDVWVIFDHPSDFPEHFVVRVQTAVSGGDIVFHPEVWLRPTLSAAREVVQVLAPGTVRLERAPDDDPVIVETWL